MALDPVALKSLAIELAAAMPPAPNPMELHAPVDVSPRGIKMTHVLQIADMYNWHSAITHFLQMKGVPYISDLTNAQLDDLVGRMDGYVDAAETGCSLPDCLPAC